MSSVFSTLLKLCTGQPQALSQQKARTTHQGNRSNFFHPGGGGTGGFLFDSADLLDAVSAIRSPNRSDFLPVEGDWGMVHVRGGYPCLECVSHLCAGRSTRLYVWVRPALPGN